MKKVLTLLCALALTAGAFALPIAKKAAPVQPIQKAAQSDYQFTSPVNFVAINQEASAGDYVIYFYDANGSLIISADIKTSSNNSIAGVYTVGTEGGQAYSSVLYAGGQKYAINYGKLSIISRGTDAATGEDIYDIVGSDWEVSDGQNVVTYGFAGQVTGYAAWKSYYQNCVNNQTDCEKARITLTETQPAVAAEVTCFSNSVDVNESTLSKGYWDISGAGYADDGKVYSLTAYLYGDQVIGSYCNDDVATTEDENNGTQRLIYFSVSQDDGQTYSDLTVTNFYGTVTQAAPGTRRYDFYVTAGGKLYHVVLYTGTNDINTMLYDTDADFRASFSLDQMTPLTTENFTGTYNGCQYFSVEVNNGTQYADLLFFAKNTDPVITIPAGRYSVSANNVANTMQKGEIMEDEQYGAYYNASYAATLASQGGQLYIDKGFLITDGIAEVTNADGLLYIVVNGSNSYYRTVQLTIGTPPAPPVDGIEEVKMEQVQDGQKMMIDGQLYIKRGDNLYNAQGKIVK